jgi:homoserine dehydrogenase
MVRARLGLLGSGAVGEALQDILFQNSPSVAARTGLELKIAKIYTRHPEKKKWYRTYPELFTTRADEVIDHADVDVVVEVLGAEKPADVATYKDYILRAFDKGKDVVTSDKAVLARFGMSIWRAAAARQRELRFEACVGGGIPIIRSLAESFAAEDPEGVFGIVNGTCNFVLSEMEAGGKSFAEAIAEAQKRGYAETDPSADTTGLDAEAKLILLAAVTFGTQIEPGMIVRSGIEQIQPIDFLYADRKGTFTIKHLSTARRSNGSIAALIAPFLIPQQHLIASIDGATNAIFFKGNRSAGQRAPTEAATTSTQGMDWNYAFIGPGSGGAPTAIAVLGDICDLVRGRKHPLPGLPVSAQEPSVLGEENIYSRFYLRFLVQDRPGIVGEICQILGSAGINISEVWQLSHPVDELQRLAQSYGIVADPALMLPFVITLEQTSLAQLRAALKSIGAKEFNLVPPLWIPIWKSS